MATIAYITKSICKAISLESSSKLIEDRKFLKKLYIVKKKFLNRIIIIKVLIEYFAKYNRWAAFIPSKK